MFIQNCNLGIRFTKLLTFLHWHWHDREERDFCNNQWDEPLWEEIVMDNQEHSRVNSMQLNELNTSIYVLWLHSVSSLKESWRKSFNSQWIISCMHDSQNIIHIWQVCTNNHYKIQNAHVPKSKVLRKILKNLPVSFVSDLVVGQTGLRNIFCNV